MTKGVADSLAEGRDELTEAESREYLAAEIDKYLRMSLDEFLRRAQDGTLPEHPMVAHLVLLSGARSGPC